MKIKICSLCKLEIADKMNSHIIPRFICKGLFEDTKPRHSILLNNKGGIRKLQDTPKENNLLCSKCEKRIEILETYFGRKFIDINNYINIKDGFDIIEISDQKYLLCKNIKPILFKLFIYSLIWRTSISSLIEFEKFNLNLNTEDEIRSFLDENLKLTHKELLENSEKNIIFPNYHFCVIKPIIKTKNSRGIFTTYNAGPNSYLLMLVDFAIYFFTTEDIDETFRFYSNKQNKNVIIAMGENEKWKKLNEIIVEKMLK